MKTESYEVVSEALGKLARIRLDGRENGQQESSEFRLLVEMSDKIEEALLAYMAAHEPAEESSQ